MKKSYLVMAVAAALFAACSNNDLVEEKSPQTTQQTAEQAVNFDAYLNRGVTRAGAVGTLTTDGSGSTTNLRTEGFGVFGYYSNNEMYNEASKPDFFYNQMVNYSAGEWKYTPVKYWPNEFGTNAVSEGIDRLTFFAYAPYAAVDLTTGIVTGDQTSGIVALSRNTSHGDPFVKYFASMDPAKRVDFCWGVAAEDFKSAVDGDNNNITAGETFVNLIKPKTADKIKFNFRHALSQLNVQIDADVDIVGHATSDALATGTKIYVRSVTFEGFADKGMFNLNTPGNTPKWYDLSGINELATGKVTIYDGRRDGREGQKNAAVSNELPNNLNSSIIQKETSTAGVVGGTPVNLFNHSTANEPIMVIPVNQPLKVTIVYDVETEDPNLPTYLSDGETRGSSIENAITQDILIGGSPVTLEAGKNYTINLHLGMTSVKFDAEVKAWVDGGESNTYLPYNELSAGSTANKLESATATSGTVTIYGLTSGNKVSEDSHSGIVTSASFAPATISTDGNTVATYVISANTTVNDRTGSFNVLEKTAGDDLVTTTTVNVKQKAAPLGLGISSIAVNATEITITSTAAGISWGTDVKQAATDITVSKNGTPLTYKTGSTPGEGEFCWDAGNHKIILNNAQKAAANDKFTIYVKAGDAAAETKTAEVPGA